MTSSQPSDAQDRPASGFPIDLAPRLRPMRPSDLDNVMRLEQVSFPTPWLRSTYERQLRQRRSGFYYVVTPDTDGGGSAAPSLLAYGGFWLVGNEAHITTIAVHPDWRRRHVGEWLLIRMIEQARQRRARTVTLEVRPSNTSARRLYTKLGFVQVGVRKQYYMKTNEDALLLTLFDIHKAQVWEPLVRRRDEIEHGT